MRIAAIKRGFDKMVSWQVIKGFDKSEIHDVFSIYLHRLIVGFLATHGL